MKRNLVMTFSLLAVFSIIWQPSKAQTKPPYSYTSGYGTNNNGKGGGPGSGNGATDLHEPVNPNGDGKIHDKTDNGIGNNGQDEGVGNTKENAPIDGGIAMALIASTAYGIKRSRDKRKGKPENGQIS